MAFLIISNPLGLSIIQLSIAQIEMDKVLEEEFFMFDSIVQGKISKDEAINLILSSIAMEELALSHIINAEGEKIQYALGTLEGQPPVSATIDDILKVNNSVKNTLEASAKNQLILREKMSEALSAASVQGITGPPGPQGDPGITVNLVTTTEYEALPVAEKLDPSILWVIYPNGFILAV